MAVVLMRTADIRDLTQFAVSSGMTISSTQARTGTYSYYASSACTLGFQLPNASTYYIKFGWYFDSNVGYLKLWEGGTNHLTFIPSIATGEIQVRRGNETGTIIGTSSGASLEYDVWFCIEIKTFINNSTGTVDIKVNGASVLSLSGADTNNSGAVGEIDYAAFTHPTAGGWYVDDLVVDDADYPGQGGLYALTVDGDGADTDWTASAGNRYECVDDNPPNNDTDYISVYGGVALSRNSFTISNLPITPNSIKSVAVLAKAALDAAGTGAIKPYLDSGGTDYDGDAKNLDVSYVWAEHYWDTDPNTASAWSESGVNAIEAGVVTA